ncbi:MAG: hemerythrin domain-containing protein, partial [Bacteroidota bacterium]
MSITIRSLLGLALVVGLVLVVTEAMAADCSCRDLLTKTARAAMDSGITGGLTGPAYQANQPRPVTECGFCAQHGYVRTAIPTAVVVVRNADAVFDEIRQQHRQVAVLMQQVLDASSDRRADAYNQFRMALIPHLKAEEATLYRALDELNRTHMLAVKSEEEHHAAANLLGELETTPMGNDRWLARFVVLRDMILHHVGEEEGRVFPAALMMFNPAQLSLLYDQFNQQEQQIASTLQPVTTVSYAEPSTTNASSRYDY